MMDRELVERMDNLHSYKKMDVALELLSYIASELIEEGFEKEDAMEYIDKRVGMHLMLDV